jgi:hypothetical protein
MVSPTDITICGPHDTLKRHLLKLKRVPQQGNSSQHGRCVGNPPTLTTKSLLFIAARWIQELGSPETPACEWSHRVRDENTCAPQNNLPVAPPQSSAMLGSTPRPPLIFESDSQQRPSPRHPATHLQTMSSAPVAQAISATPPPVDSKAATLTMVPTSPDPSSTYYLQVSTPATKFGGVTSMATASPRASGDYTDDDGGAETITGVQLFAWGSSLTDWDYRSRYDWVAWLLPCVAVPQIELRMGLVSNVWLASASYLLAQVVAVAMAGCVTISLFDRTLYDSNSESASLNDGSSRELAVMWLLLLLSFLGLQIYCLTRNLAVLRCRVRARLSIPGSYADDLRASFLRPASVVRQMGRQIRCDAQPLPCCDHRPAQEQTQQTVVVDHEFVMSGHV